MRVRMRAGLSGTVDGQAWPPAGGEVDLPDGVAAKLIRNGQAVAVEESGVEVVTEVETRPAPTADVETRDDDQGDDDEEG